jgi:hypothetical protein
MWHSALNNREGFRRYLGELDFDIMRAKLGMADALYWQ